MQIIETTSDSAPIEAALKAGLKTLSRDQKVTFQKYDQAILPLDGYVFWVKDLNTASIEVQGSLHYDIDKQQRVDEIIGINKVLFTTNEEIQAFNDIDPASIWIGEIDAIRFAFTRRGKLYKAANTFHYSGDAIYPTMYSQIIDNPANPVDLGSVVVSNSIPLWLALNQYMPIYPAFLVGANIRPPYAAVEITETKPIQSAPLIDYDSNSYQLMQEKAKIIIHGLRSDEAIDFLNYVFDDTLSNENFGILNMPAIVDEKRGQSELGILAQKKIIEFEINYYQNRVQTVGRKLILSGGIQIAADPYALLDAFVLNKNFVG